MYKHHQFGLAVAGTVPQLKNKSGAVEFAQEAISNFLFFFPTVRCGSAWAERQSKPRYCFVDDGRSIPSQIGRIQPEVPPRSFRAEI